MEEQNRARQEPEMVGLLDHTSLYERDFIEACPPGLDEKIYENALVFELRSQGHRVEQQRSFCVRYRGELVGQLVPDLIVEESVIVDTKGAESFNELHVAQMIGYLSITNLRLALLINFKHADLRWKRVVR